MGLKMKNVLVIYDCDNDYRGSERQEWIETEELQIEDNISLEELQRKLNKQLKDDFEKTSPSNRYGRYEVNSIYEYTKKTIY